MLTLCFFAVVDFGEVAMLELSEFVHHVDVGVAAGVVGDEVFAEGDDVLVGGLFHAVDVDVAEGGIVVGFNMIKVLEVGLLVVGCGLEFSHG